MSEYHCRMCELMDIINNSDDPDTAQEVFMDETMDGMMDYLLEDDVYLYLDEKYRKQTVIDMSEHEYQHLLAKIKGEDEQHLKIIVNKEIDRTLN